MCLRRTVASPSASSDPGRSSNTTARSSSIAPRASSETRRSSAAAPARSRSSSVDADSAASATPNSRCVTESCSSRASRLRSSMMLSSRAALVQPRVLDRDRGVRGEQPISRWSASENIELALLLGQVQRADHLAAGDDRHAEERAHRRVRARPPAAKARMAADVVGPVRLGRIQHRAEHPVRARERTHRLDQLVAHPGRDEARERALAVRDAERRVARAGELARGVHEPLQHGLDLVLGREREHDVGERAEGGAVGGGHCRPTRYAAGRRRPIGRWS